MVFLVVPIPVFADHVPTQPPYDQSLALDTSTGDLTVGIYSSDGFEDSPPEKYTIFFTISDSAIDTSTSFCISTSFGHGTNLSWQYHVFSLEDLQAYFEIPNGTFRTKIRADNDTDNSFSTLTDEMTIVIPDQLPFVNLANWSAPSSSCVDTSTTTTSSSTTLDPLETERNTNFSETGILETNQERSDREAEEAEAERKAQEKADREAQEEAERIAAEKAEAERIEAEINNNFNETGFYETDNERASREEAEYLAELDANFEETGFYETDDERAEREEIEYQIYLEELEAAEEAEILAELEDSIDLEDLGLVVVECPEDDEECENLSDDEIAKAEADLKEFIDAIQKIEEETDFDDFDVEEEVLELSDLEIPDDLVVIIFEPEEEEETEKVLIIEDFADEVIEVVEVDLNNEVFDDVSDEVAETVIEIIDSIEIVEDQIPEIPEEIIEDLTAEEVEEVVEVYVETLTETEKVEIIEDVVDAGVEELSEEQVVVVQEVVESAIDDVKELTEEQVETVAEVLGLEESDDVAVIAEAVKTDDAVAEAVDTFVERAVENKEVEDYNLSDVVVEVQIEEFLENPGVIFQVDFEEISFAGLGDDLTNQQKEKAQEVVVPVIIASQIISASVVPYRRIK